jgi:hypothetical protein
LTGPYPPPPAATPANDRSQLYGILGLVIGLFCCSPAGIVLGYLSIQEAKKYGKPTTLGMVALIVSIVALVLGILAAATGVIGSIIGTSSGY